MSLKEYYDIVSKVLLDWRVISTVVVVILIVFFTNMTIHYKKRPKVRKSKKVAAPKPAPAPAAEEAADEEAEE